MVSSSTRTLLFGIFVLARRTLTAAEIVALSRPLGISATNAKSHLTRMVAEGALERTGPRRRARYGPSKSQAAVVEGIEARLRADPDEPWNGEWMVLTLKMPANRGERERLRALLWFDGFRPWDGSTFARPAWPQEWAAARARHYLAGIPGLGIQGELVGNVATSRLYDLDALDREARKLAARIREKRIPVSSPARAFAARLEVGGMVARLAGHDPRLPKSIWGKRNGMRDLGRAFAAFEKRVVPAAQRFLHGV
jgi:DNA-binding transcriptional regulator PaaX